MATVPGTEVTLSMFPRLDARGKVDPAIGPHHFDLKLKLHTPKRLCIVLYYRKPTHNHLQLIDFR